MFRRTALNIASRGIIRRQQQPIFRMESTSSSPPSKTPIEDAIREKITASLSPRTLEIYNDSHLHAHHKAMENSTSSETHFRLIITSEAFRSKQQPARHRLVYGLLREEMAMEGGIHALQLKTMTPDEEDTRRHLEEKRKGLEEGTGIKPTTCKGDDA